MLIFLPIPLSTLSLFVTRFLLCVQLEKERTPKGSIWHFNLTPLEHRVIFEVLLKESGSERVNNQHDFKIVCNPYLDSMIATMSPLYWIILARRMKLTQSIINQKLLSILGSYSLSSS